MDKDKTIKGFDATKIGDVCEMTHRITSDDIKKFVELTGDNNPLHWDEDFAKATDFRRPIAHGMLSASFLSTMVGMLLPGPGALWLSQSLKFLRQVYENDTIRIVAKVKQKSDASRVLVLETMIYNQHNEEVITGEGQVKMLSAKQEDKFVEKKIKVVLVTGASRGIGAAIARKLASEGHSVIVNFAKNKAEAEKVVEMIKSQKGKAVAIQADISSEEDVKTMCQKAKKEFGSIDAFVQNASGAINLKTFNDLSWNDIQRHLDVQLKGAFLCLRQILPVMTENGGGSVVVIGSVAVDSIPPAKQTAYAIGKAALMTFAKSLAAEYGPKNIRVNVVSPGLTVTDLTASIPAQAKELTRMTTPLRRLAQPEDIADAVSFLISPGSRHITGETLRVCGGMVML